MDNSVPWSVSLVWSEVEDVTIRRTSEGCPTRWVDPLTEALSRRLQEHPERVLAEEEMQDEDPVRRLLRCQDERLRYLWASVLREAGWEYIRGAQMIRQLEEEGTASKTYAELHPRARSREEKPKWLKTRESGLVADYMKVRAWLNNPADDGRRVGSFVWICNVLGLDPDWVRRRVEKAWASSRPEHGGRVLCRLIPWTRGEQQVSVSAVSDAELAGALQDVYGAGWFQAGQVKVSLRRLKRMEREGFLRSAPSPYAGPLNWQVVETEEEAE